MKVLPTILVVLTSLAMGGSQDLILIEQDIRDLQGSDVLEELDVVHVSTDWLLALSGVELEARSDMEVLLEGPVDLESLRLVHIRNESGLTSAAEMGEVLLNRDGAVLVLITDASSIPFAALGVHLVQPLRIYNRRAYAPFRPGGALDDPVITDIVASVDQDSLIAMIQHLEDYGTRLCVTPEFEEACLWVQEKFQSFGLAAEIQDFEFTLYGSTYESANVIAELPGTVEPDVIVIICGHLDSITYGNPYVTAPGADDNGSGSAAVLEAARILSEYDFHRTIRFICFGAEEVGLIGSAFYAAEAAAAGDSIIAVMNLDMILYAPDSLRRLFVPYDTQSTYLAFDFLDAANTYVPELELLVEYSPGTTYSDHSSFWQEGYPALLGIEEGVNQNPYYHQETDLLANYSEYFPFGTECAQAAIALTAIYAEPLGTGIEGGGTVQDRCTITASPVPADHVITVTLTGISRQGATVSLLDLTGRIQVYTPVPPGGGSVNLDVSALPAGSYLILAEFDGVSVSRLITVVR